MARTTSGRCTWPPYMYRVFAATLTSWFIARSRKSMRMWTWIGRSPARAMPTAAPVIASSDSGVPNTRPGPYFSSRPRVVPWIAFGSSTSRPKTITFGSRAISRSAASRTASTNDSVRPAAARLATLPAARGEGIDFLLEDVRGEFGDVRERAALGERERGGDLGLHLAFDRGPLGGREFGGEPADRVSFDPRPALGRGPVAELEVLAGADVLAPAVGRHLEEPRPAAGADRRDHLGGAAEEPGDVVAVEPLGRQPERLGLRANVRPALPPRLVGVDRVPVVLADEDHRQPLEGGEVERLGEDALLRRPVAEEAHDHGVRAAELQGVGVPGGVGDGRADHGGRAQHAGLGVDQVHRPALTAGAAGRAAVQFGDHRVEVAALGEVHGVAAVGAED